VCDSFSTDKTLDIARQYSSRIIQHEYVNSATQKNWAIPQAAYEWVLVVDTDERISPALREEIVSVLEDPGLREGFWIPRDNVILGRHLRHGGYWPDYQLRLFKKTKGRYQLREVHAHLNLDGEAGRLHSPITHFPVQSSAQVVEKYFKRYASWEAKERLKRERPSWAKLLGMPPAVFLYRYIFKKGFLDGISGMVMAGLWGMHIFFAYFHMLRWKEKK
jgi:glycosyltransferase involved in cell wall biosynthesis